MGTPEIPSDQALNRGIAAYQKVVRGGTSTPSGAGPLLRISRLTDSSPVPAAPQAKPPKKTETEAQQFLRETLGSEKGETLYKQAAARPQASGTAGNPFDFLEDFTPGQLSLFFRDESPAAEALVLSRLPSKTAALVIADAGPERRAELALRIAHKGETAPEVLERVAAVLREKARRFSLSPDSEEAAEIDGMGALTAILKAGEISFGDRLLDELEKDEPGLGRFIKDRLYTLDDAAFIPDRVMEEKLRTMTDHEIIFLLKNPLEGFRQKIIANLSEGRETRIREEAEILGPVARIEVEAAARDFLAWFRATGPWVTEEKVI